MRYLIEAYAERYKDIDKTAIDIKAHSAENFFPCLESLNLFLIGGQRQLLLSFIEFGVDVAKNILRIVNR